MNGVDYLSSDNRIKASLSTSWKVNEDVLAICSEISSDRRMWDEATRPRCGPFLRRLQRTGTLMLFRINVNGVKRTVDVDGDMPLLWVLRDVLGMTGTKFGCGIGRCGACTVLIDGTPTRSCIKAVSRLGTAVVTTIEAIGETPSGRRIQGAWLELEVVQCGYCQPGQVMSDWRGKPLRTFRTIVELIASTQPTLASRCERN
jgi:isoquinoline 1-oxidoreductase alpha subunit